MALWCPQISFFPPVLERIVFHIGTHKTGTTAIQGSLADSYEHLLGQGVLYPRAGRAGDGHAALAYEILDSVGPVSELSCHLRLVEEALAIRPATLIVSAEDLSDTEGDRPVAWARRLCEALNPDRVEVLGYVRPQWELLESRYNQRLKRGAERAPFNHYVERLLPTNSLDYVEKFRPWREAFGDGVDIRPFRADLLVGGDVVADFWSAVGLGGPPAVERRDNQRAGARTTEMLRLLRVFLADHNLDGLLPPPLKAHARPRRQAVGQALDRARERINAAFPDDEDFSVLTRETVDRVVERFSTSNAEFVRTYFGGRHEDFFSPPRHLRRVTTWSLREASEKERRFFAQLVAETLAELLPETPVPRPAPAVRPDPSPAARWRDRPHAALYRALRRQSGPLRRRLRRRSEPTSA